MSSRLVRQASFSLLGKKHPPALGAPEVNLHSNKRTMRLYQQPHEQHAKHDERPFAVVRFPSQSTTWIRGSPVVIEWTVLDASASTVCLELLQMGSSATTVLAPVTPNSGYFWLERVPWGILGDNFYIRLTEIATASPRSTHSETFSIATDRQWYPNVNMRVKQRSALAM
ncbi:unnamed protein product [Aphanomyces euteiches]